MWLNVVGIILHDFMVDLIDLLSSFYVFKYETHKHSDILISRTCYFILIIYDPFSANAIVVLINIFVLKNDFTSKTKFIRLNFGAWAYASFCSKLTSNGQVLLLGNNLERDFLTELKHVRGFINP